MAFPNFEHCAKSQAELTAFHPGPGNEAPPPAVRRTPAERLALAESQLLAFAIEDHVHGKDGQMRDLAVLIIALRAEVRQ